MKNKKGPFLVLCIVFLLFFSTVSASLVQATAKPDKNVFYAGETISIQITLKNTTDNSLYLELEYYLLRKESIYPSLTETKSVLVKPLEERKFAYTYEVQNTNAPGKYEFILQGWIGAEKIFEKKAGFSIKGTKKILNIGIKTCQDKKCENPKKVFLKGENIYLDFDSSTKSPLIDANLGFPDGTTKKISLPYSFKAEQTGTYNLRVKTSKEGYRSTEQTIQFGVIEKEPEIQQAKEEISFAVRVCEEGKWVESPPAAKTKKTCIEPKTVFETGQKIVIYPETTAKIKAKITYPNKTTKTLTLPISLELKQKGTYIIEATVEKTGWKKTTKITTIEVKEAGKKPSDGQPVNFTLIAGGIITVMVILGIIILIKLKK